MNVYLLAKDYRKQLMTYVTILCLLFTCHAPASADVAVLTNKEDCDRRLQVAYGVAGIAAVVLIGGLVYAASVSGHKCHHSSSSCDSSCSYYSCYDYSSCYSSCSSCSSDHHHSNHRRHSGRHHHRDSYSYDYYDSDLLVREVFPQGVIAPAGDVAVRQKLKKSPKASKKTDELSGMFIAHPTTLGQGSVKAFVRLPDGSTHVLGHVSLSGQTTCSIPFGPFNQMGHYTFGVSVDEGASIPVQTNIGSIHIEVNGSTAQSCDFILPPNASAHYEPAPCCYSLH